MRVRLTSDKAPKWILEPSDAARTSKHVRDIPDELATRFIRAQQAYWGATADLALELEKA